MSLDVQSQHVVTLSRAMSIYSCSRVVEEGLQHRITLLFHCLSGTAGLLDDFHWAKQYRSERNVCVSSSASSVNCCAARPPTHTHTKNTQKSINTIMPLCQNELLLSTWRKTLIYSHQIMLFWTHRNPAVLRKCHCATHVVVLDTTVPPVVRNLQMHHTHSPLSYYSENQTAFKMHRLFLLLSGNSDLKNWKLLKIENLEKANYM